MSMEGPPQIPKQESGVESIPTREEILLEISKYCENLKVVQEKKDEKGVYILRVEPTDQKPGETVDYTYQREGSFGDMSSERTSIFVTYVENGEVVGAEDKAHYNPQTKKWE